MRRAAGLAVLCLSLAVPVVADAGVRATRRPTRVDRVVAVIAALAGIAPPRQTLTTLGKRGATTADRPARAAAGRGQRRAR